MKTTSLAVAGAEAEAYLSKAQLPKLSYNKAVSSWIRLPSGQVSQVWSCSAEMFRAFVESCISTNDKLATATKNEFARLLSGELDELCRWFVILELKAYRVETPLFESEQEVRQSHEQKQANTHPV